MLLGESVLIDEAKSGVRRRVKNVLEFVACSRKTAPSCIFIYVKEGMLRATLAALYYESLQKTSISVSAIGSE